MKETYLRENGFDLESALSYLGDMETFDEILKDFYDVMDNQMLDIENTKNNMDMQNYAILVHALKSNCRTLGISEFTEIAYKHELAGKENNINFVNENYNELIKIKEKYKEIINKYLNM